MFINDGVLQSPRLEVVAVNNKAVVIRYVYYIGYDAVTKKVVVKRRPEDVHDPVKALAYALLEVLGLSKTKAKKFIQEMLDKDTYGAEQFDRQAHIDAMAYAMSQPSITPITPIIYLPDKFSHDRLRRHLKDWYRQMPLECPTHAEWWAGYMGYVPTVAKQLLKKLCDAEVMERVHVKGQGFMYKKTRNILMVKDNKNLPFGLEIIPVADDAGHD